MPNTALHRTTVANLFNKSGGALAYGAVVRIDTANAESFTTTTTVGFADTPIGVIIEPNGIASNARGLVAFSSWIAIVNLNAAATIGQLIKTHSVAGQGTPHSAPVVAGDFAIALEASATPKCLLFGMANQGSGGAVGDGDKGDITVTVGGTVWTIDNNVVTYAKMQDVSAASKLLGRGASVAGDPEEITLGTGLTMTGTTLSSSGGGGAESWHPFLL